MPEVKIIDTEVIVLSDNPNDMGEDDKYFSFADKGGTTHRIKVNRKSAIELLTTRIGLAVQLNYGEYEGFKYIHAVTVPKVDVGVDVPPPKTTTEKALDDKGVTYEKTAKPLGVEIGKCENQIVQLFIAGKLSAMFGEEIGIILLEYVQKNIATTLPVNIDIKRLPKFKGKESS